MKVFCERDNNKTYVRTSLEHDIDIGNDDDDLTDDPLRAPPHPDDVLRDRQVVRSTYPLNGVQETENLMIIPTSQYLAATLTWQVIKNYLYEKMNTHYLAETLIGWVVENSARRLNVSFILSSSSHRRLMFMLVTDHDENEE